MPKVCSARSQNARSQYLARIRIPLTFVILTRAREEKVEFPDFWPENVTVSRLYLNKPPVIG